MIKSQNTIMKKATVNSSPTKPLRQVTDFTKMSAPSKNIQEEFDENEDEKKLDFYEVDLSDEENRRDKKAIMSLKRKNKQTNK